MSRERLTMSNTIVQVQPGFEHFGIEKSPTSATVITTKATRTDIPDVDKLPGQSRLEDLKSSIFGVVAVGLALYGAREVLRAFKDRDLSRGVKGVVALYASDLFVDKMQEYYKASKTSAFIKAQADEALENLNLTSVHEEPFLPK